MAGERRQIPAERVESLAVAVPADIARFEGQKAVFLGDLLQEIVGPAEHVRCVSPRGESFVVEASERAGFSLLSTNAPSWKLVPAGRTKLDEITTPRFVLREVAAIETGVDAREDQTSDQVFTNLSDALREPPAVRFLNLTSAHLESFPSGVLELPNLESLNLGNNNVDAVPPEIGELKKLTVLKLSRNRIAALPEEIGRLKRLSELHASHNCLASLPEKLWNLEQLEVLSLGSNQLASIPPEIAKLTQLRELMIDHNPISPAARQTIEQNLAGVQITW